MIRGWIFTKISVPSLELFSGHDAFKVMKLRRGDVIAFDFPFSDASGSKIRPALVVSADTINEQSTSVIIAAIGRSFHRATARHVLVDPSASEGRTSGLREPSLVQCDKLLTVDKKFLLGTLGTLPPSVLKRVNEALIATLGL